MLVPGTRTRGLLTLAGFSCLATAVACGPDAAPELAGLSDQVAQVGSELTIDLDGTDPDGDRLHYGFHAADLPDLDRRAQITQSPSGAGVFRWTPIASDIGEHAIDFTVSDGAHTATTTIDVAVRSAIGAATAPVFRQPLGSGTTLDLGQATCVDLDIVVEDQDSARVAIAQGDPVIAGAELVVRDGLSASWHWCPTPAQTAESRYTLVLAADDGDNPRTVKEFVIVLRGAPACADDAHEDDDSFGQARETTYPAFASTGNAICPGDDDWYSVLLFTAERLTIDLLFTQASDAQDLDLHLVRNGVDLWPCGPDSPSTCSREHGQGGMSNEHAVFSTPSGCDEGCIYFVVVRGFDRSANHYDLRLGIQ